MIAVGGVDVSDLAVVFEHDTEIVAEGPRMRPLTGKLARMGDRLARLRGWLVAEERVERAYGGPFRLD